MIGLAFTAAAILLLLTWLLCRDSGIDPPPGEFRESPLERDLLG